MTSAFPSDILQTGKHETLFPGKACFRNQEKDGKVLHDLDQNKTNKDNNW